MTATEPESMTALHGLLDERQRYESWIQALDEHRATAIPHVYDRVRRDYQQRLEQVVSQLAERAEQLKSTVDVLTSRLTGLQEREADRVEARQESELRAAVGEYSSEEWTTLRDDADREIATIVQEREGVERELAEMQRIIGLTTLTAPVVTPEPASLVAASVPAEPVSSIHIPLADEPEPVNVSATPSVQEPSIDDFVADWPIEHVSDVPAASATVSTTTSATTPSPAKASQATPMFTPPPMSPAMTQTSQNSGAESVQARPPHTGPVPGDPVNDGRRDQEKTLKCPECGTLNYATEWYCERCGGELATY